ncbi:hypothetical protein BDR22DRAFT_973340 [Usnea florida]
MASATTDTGYWLSEATGDQSTGKSDAGKEVIEHPDPPGLQEAQVMSLLKRSTQPSLVIHRIATEHVPSVEHTEHTSEIVPDGVTGDRGDAGEETSYMEPQEEPGQFLLDRKMDFTTVYGNSEHMRLDSNNTFQTTQQTCRNSELASGSGHTPYGLASPMFCEAKQLLFKGLDLLLAHLSPSFLSERTSCDV